MIDLWKRFKENLYVKKLRADEDRFFWETLRPLVKLQPDEEDLLFHHWGKLKAKADNAQIKYHERWILKCSIEDLAGRLK